MVVLVLAAVGLGSWQYDGWQARRAAESQDLSLVAPVPLAEALGPDDPFPASSVGRPVEVSGTWLPDTTLYVADRSRDDSEGAEAGGGYWVVGGVLVDDGSDGSDDSVLLAVRGWTAEPGRAEPVSGETRFVGWLQPPESGAGGESGQGADAPDIVPSLRIADLAQRFDQDLYGGYVVLAQTDPAAWSAWSAGERAVNPGTERLAPVEPRQLPDVSRFTALRNLLYALEWWFFGLFAVFVWWRWVRDTAAERAVVPAEEPVPAPGG